MWCIYASDWFRQWLVAWTAPSHYLNQCWNIVNWTLRNKLQWNLNRNKYIFIQQNAFENVVWKLLAILSRPQCVHVLAPCMNQPSQWINWIGGNSSMNKLHSRGRDKMAAIFQTTFSNRFSWMKMYEFRLKFHWSLSLGVQLTIFQHWFR